MLSTESSHRIAKFSTMLSASSLQMRNLFLAIRMQWLVAAHCA